MFNFKEIFDRWMTAITFAEANEHELALDFLHDRPQKKLRKKADKRIERDQEIRPQMRT